MATELPVKIVLQGQNEFKSAIDDIGKNLLKGFAVAEIGNQLFEFTKHGIEEFQAEALASAKLTNSLGYQSKALDELAKSLSKNTLYKEKDIKSAEGSLSLYVKSEAQLKQLTPAVLDLAQATGMDLDSAAKLVGRTLESNTKTMGRLGISVHGAADSHERLDSIMKGLNDRFGGSAQAMSDSQGEIAQLQKNVDLLSKDIGGALIPVLNFWAQKIIAVTEGMDWLFTKQGDWEKQLGIQNTLNESLSTTDQLLSTLRKTGGTTFEAQEQATDKLGAAQDKLAEQQEDYNKQQVLSNIPFMDYQNKKLISKYNEIQATKAAIANLNQDIALIKSAGGNADEAAKKLKGFNAALAKEPPKPKDKANVAAGDKTPEQIAAEKEAEREAKKALEERNKAINDGMKVRRQMYMTEAQKEIDDENSKYMTLRDDDDKNQQFQLALISNHEKKILEIKQKYAEEEKALLNKRHQEELDIDMRNILIVDKMEKKEQSKTFEGRFRLLKQQHKEELDSFTGSEKHRIQMAAGFAQEEAEFKKKEIEQKIGFDLQYASNTIGLMGQIAEATHANAQVMKRIKEGEAVVSAAKGALGVIENSAQFIANFGPVAGPIAMGVEIALMAGLAAAQISQIESAKMAYGGVVTGGTPGKDSVPAMLMPGEAVWNPLHPNQAIANYISNTGGNTGDTHFHVGGPTITINGNPDQKTIAKVSQTAQRAARLGTKQALRDMQTSGKLSGITMNN